MRLHVFNGQPVHLYSLAYKFPLSARLGGRQWSQHFGNLWLIAPKISAAGLAATSYPMGGSAEPLAKGGPRAKKGPWPTHVT